MPDSTLLRAHSHELIYFLINDATKCFIAVFFPSGVYVPKPAEPCQHAAEHADVAAAAAANVTANVAARRQPAGLDLYAVQPRHQFATEFERQCTW